MCNIRRVIFLIYAGFDILDLSGPLSVFSTANEKSNQTLYEIIIASTTGGLICSSCGVCVSSVELEQFKFRRKKDTVLIVGANRKPLLDACSDTKLLDALKRASIKSERFGSICSGTFLIGAAGLLTKRRCTTHWAGVEELSKHFDKAIVDQESLYVTDGRLWTSAGATTGIDMALSILRIDHGNQLMGLVAKWLVLYVHRPGYQSQFSLMLNLQFAGKGTFQPLVDWLSEVLHLPIKVSDMAEKVLMTERTFYRKFTSEIGLTPSKFLETLRLQRAKELLESGISVKRVTVEVGYRSEAAFRNAFKIKFGLSPSMHALMFKGNNSYQSPQL